MIHNDIVDLDWCKLHLEITDAISDELFVWVEVFRRPTAKDLKRARELAESVDPRFLIYANVDATNPVTMRFASHFGFREVLRNSTISVQVWERNKCKLFSSR